MTAFYPLANCCIFGIIFIADLGGGELPFDWPNLGGKRERKPVDEEVGTPFCPKYSYIFHNQTAHG